MSYIPPQPSSYHDDKLERVQVQLNDVKIVMQSNITKAIGRGENLDNLAIRSDQLLHDSGRFRDGSLRLRRKFCCKNAKMWGCIAFIGAVIITAIGLLIWTSTK